MSSIQQYLADKLIDENHPTIQYSSCSNSKQRRKICTICRDVCHNSVIGHKSSVDWDECENCNICATQCPCRAIMPSALNIRKLLELYDIQAEQITIACNNREINADIKLYCLASIPWEVLVYLALDKKIVIIIQGCEDCDKKNCLQSFYRTMNIAEEFLGTERFNEKFSYTREGNTIQAAQISRRELFSIFKKRAINVASSVIPDDTGIDALLYRKLLVKRLKSEYDEGTGKDYGWRILSFTEKCWGCGICAKVCPCSAIKMVEIDDKKYMAHTFWKCGHCGICESVCLEIGLDGTHIEYLKNPIKPVLTEISSNSCKFCGAPVNPERGELCMVCSMKGTNKFFKLK